MMDHELDESHKTRMKLEWDIPITWYLGIMWQSEPEELFSKTIS